MKFTQYIIVVFVIITSFITMNNAEAACSPTKGPNLQKYLMLRGPYNEDAFKTYSQFKKDTFLHRLFNKEEKIEAQIWLSNVIGCEDVSLNFTLRQFNQGKIGTKTKLDFASNLTSSPEYNKEKAAYIKQKDVDVKLSDICTDNGTIKNCSLEFELDTGTDKAFNSRKQEGELGYFKFQCKGDECNKSITVSLIAHVRNDAVSFDQCKLETDDVSFKKLNTDVLDYMGNGIVQMNLNTKGNCINNHPLEISIWEEDTLADDKIYLKDGDFSKSNKIHIRPIDNENLYINFKTSESECDNGDGWNCYYYVEVKSTKFGNPREIISTKFQFDKDVDTDNFKNNINYKKGVILGKCADSKKCLSNSKWEILKTNGIAYSTSPEQIFTTEPTYDPKSPCLKNPNDASEGYDDNCYELLAPIPGIGKEINGRYAVDNLSSFKFGDYVNKLFQLALAILIVVSVIVIVFAGVEYMTVESIYGKSHAKNRIIGAVTGLIMGLGIYVILNTINPQLLIIDFEKHVKTVDIAGGGIGINLNSLPKRTGTDPRGISPQWAQENAPTMTFKKVDGTTITVKACDESNMVTYTAFGKKVTTRKELKPTVIEISNEWNKMGANKYPVNSLGGYNCRTIATTGSNAKKISTHAYGVTLDFNPTKNPYILAMPSGGWGDVSTYSDMPKSFRDLFIKKGFGWGGNWKNIKDAMHFSKSVGEQGDGILKDA